MAINPRAVEGLLLGLDGGRVHPRTHNVLLGALRFAFHGGRGRNPTIGVPPPTRRGGRPEILSGSEVKRLLEPTASPKYRAIFLLAYGAGLRVSEAVGLETADIDSERVPIHVRARQDGTEAA